MDVMRQQKRDETVIAHYSCKRCKLFEIDIEVPERTDDVNVPTWLIRTIYPLAMEDHKKRSAECEERFLDIGLRPPDYQPQILASIEVPGVDTKQ